MGRTTFYLEKRIPCYIYRILNKYSKELFDYGVGIHKTKGRLSEKKKKM